MKKSENLREIAEAMKFESKKNIKIIGHTDSDGTDEYNLKLSQQNIWFLNYQADENMVQPGNLLLTGAVINSTGCLFE